MAMLSPSYGTGPVALLAEGVDRNSQIVIEDDALITSPSSRRAWIEMSLMVVMSGPDATASPSSRRAWIEIGFYRA